ncbi:MAG: hypothetical protein U9O98_01140 [Asgard group archaeon]|nr:hypothetical protein [Asgard group archaeon]
MIEEYIDNLKNELEQKENRIQELISTKSNLKDQKESAIERLRKMEEEMEELSSVYEDLRKQKDVQIDLQEVMRLYVILTEQVLNGNAHMRLLTLLHGKKDLMTKDELSKASGIQPAPTLRAIFDLRNNGLVTYNEQNEEVKLVKRLFD